jgi:DNA polymerase-3 subunit epsilon
MLNLKKFLFKDGTPAHLPADVRAALEVWRATPAPALDEVHFHTRYVVVEITSSGNKLDSDQLLSIAASSVRQSTILPDDAFFADLAGQGDDAAATTPDLKTIETTAGPRTIETEAGPRLDRQLLAFLQFAAKCPLVTYNVPYVGGFLQRAYKERLGVDFQPQWIDLAWLLPAMFSDRGSSIMPLDHWIEVFGFDAGNGRRSAMENTLMLARIFQMLLVRAVGKQIDTAAQLLDESRASTFLRRTH